MNNTNSNNTYDLTKDEYCLRYCGVCDTYITSDGESKVICKISNENSTFNFLLFIVIVLVTVIAFILLFLFIKSRTNRRIIRMSGDETVKQNKEVNRENEINRIDHNVILNYNLIKKDNIVIDKNVINIKVLSPIKQTISNDNSVLVHNKLINSVVKESIRLSDISDLSIGSNDIMKNTRIVKNNNKAKVSRAHRKISNLVNS